MDAPENRAAFQSASSLADACRDRQILEGRAMICDSNHNLIVDCGCMRGIIPREEGAIGMNDGSVRDIAVISRVNRPVCFWSPAFKKAKMARQRLYFPAGSPGAVPQGIDFHLDSR